MTRAVRPASRSLLRLACGLLDRRHRALRPAPRPDRRAAPQPDRPFRAGSGRLQPHAGHLGRRRVGHAAGRDGFRRRRRARLACGRGRAVDRCRSRRCATCNCRTGARGPTTSPIRPATSIASGTPAVDGRRPGLAAGPHPSARLARRAGGRGAGQRRHLRHRSPAHLLLHAADAPGPQHDERPACTKKCSATRPASPGGA